MSLNICIPFLQYTFAIYLFTVLGITLLRLGKLCYNIKYPFKNPYDVCMQHKPTYKTNKKQKTENREQKQNWYKRKASRSDLPVPPKCQMAREVGVAVRSGYLSTNLPFQAEKEAETAAQTRRDERGTDKGNMSVLWKQTGRNAHRELRCRWKEIRDFSENAKLLRRTTDRLRATKDGFAWIIQIGRSADMAGRMITRLRDWGTL